MRLFDLTRSAYNLGFKHGHDGERRKPAWELILTNPQCLLDKDGFISGYHQGYHDGTIKRKFILPERSPYAAFRRDD